MLHILLLILKIIGITILILVGLIFLLACTVLFVPIRYEANVNTPDGIEHLYAKVRVSWIFRLFSFRATYESKKFIWNFRIIGIKIKLSKKRKKIAKKESPIHEEKSEDSNTEKETENEEKQGWLKRIVSKVKKIWNIKKMICEFIKNSIHKKAFRLFKNELRFLAKKYKPRKLKGTVRFGCEDPYETGKILALLSVLYPFYCENVQIEPDFEEAVLEGHLDLKGHIRIWWLVVSGCRLFFDKHIRKTIEDGRRCIDNV